MTKDIQEAVCKYIAIKGHEAICENFGYNWEMDVASLSKSGMLHEYEVKISRSDFLADKKRKGIKFAHYEQIRSERTCPHYFYYVCPKDLIKKGEIPSWAGLYYYLDGKLSVIQTAKRLHKGKINMEKVLAKMLRLNVQRKYLGGSMLTYLNNKMVDEFKTKMNPIQEENTLFSGVK